MLLVTAEKSAGRRSRQPYLMSTTTDKNMVCATALQQAMAHLHKNAKHARIACQCRGCCSTPHVDILTEAPAVPAWLRQ